MKMEVSNEQTDFGSILAVSIVLTAFSANLFAEEQTSKKISNFKDMSDHWAADKVNSLVEMVLYPGTMTKHSDLTAI
jgi:hypothetical protein